MKQIVWVAQADPRPWLGADEGCVALEQSFKQLLCGAGASTFPLLSIQQLPPALTLTQIIKRETLIWVTENN